MEVGYGTCQWVLTEELGMHRVAAKFVPRILTAEQKQQRVNVCTELCQLTSDEEMFLSRVITDDESWVYDPETKQQPSQWKSPTSPRPKKARQVKSNLKSMIITLFDTKGIVHKEFVPTGRIPGSNAKFCRDCVKRCEDIAPNFGKNRPGCFTITTPHLTLPSSPTSFWRKTKLLLSPTHRTPLIWHPVTSSYFQK